MEILNIAGYKFISLDGLESLRKDFLALCTVLALKGTMLLSREGINISIAGTVESIRYFRKTLKDDARFSDMTFRESYSDEQPFKNLKVKLKNEIISFRQPNINPSVTPAPAIAPSILKQWLDEQREMTLLDTRNNYEVSMGTFKGALNLNLSNFGQLPAAVQDLKKDKPVVMFCTGGIRCEKAAIYMINQGFSEVYQLEGGILNYFAQVGKDHYDGDCFVFDERIAVDASVA
jgi:UPF0176 protein